MRRALIVLALIPLWLADGVTAQAPRAAQELPVKRVVLYKTGVGYFEHLGEVRGSQNITIRFTSAQLDDVLKSLTAIDLGNGQVTGISYNSAAPLDRRLGALRLPLAGNTTTVQVLESLRGARVEVTAGAATSAGRLLTVEQHAEDRDGRVVTRTIFSVLTDTGEMRTFELSPSVQVRLADTEMRRELGRYLDVLGSTREQDVRNMVISTSGAGPRSLFVSYVSEVPIWKSTYRLVVPDKGKPFIQGWAIVDNTVGEDWTNVELSLVAGAPQSYIQRLSQPQYGRRPVVPLPSNVQLQPQTHGATLERGAGTVTGRIVDAGGAVIPGATVRLLDTAGNEAASTVSAGDGRYRLEGPPGSYTLQAQMPGFSATAARLMLNAGGHVTQDITLRPGALSESLATDALAPRSLGTIAGAAGGRPASPPPPPAPAARAYEGMRQMPPGASGAELGELFEYRIKEPVTLRKDQSALVPILNAELSIERVSLWNRASGSGRPLRALWMTNSTGLTLDGGSVTVIEADAFAGEGLIEPVKPGERRLVSYAADLGVLVEAKSEGAPRRIQSIRASNGVLVQETEDRASWTYTARNEGKTPTTLVIEHPLRAGWQLAEGQSPAERTAGAARFRVVIEAGKESTLQVREVHPSTARITLGDITEAQIAQLAASGVDAAALRRALQPVIDKRTDLARIQQRLDALEAERARIVDDQQRLRENMKALRGSAEERQLLQRYTRQLDEQENRLADLRTAIDRTTAERDAARAELSRVIGSVEFEIEAGR